MPELPEVETVKNVLQLELVGHTIIDVHLYYDSLIVGISKEEFYRRLKGNPILDLKRRGKWLIFEFAEEVLLSHLRMEGKYVFRTPNDAITPHEHISFLLENGQELRYQDTRKFGRMYLLKKDHYQVEAPICFLGLEPWDQALTVSYLEKKFSKKHIPIKTALLDQGIIAGIGNIYANEILFLCHLSPFCECSKVRKDELKKIINETRSVLAQAIKEGGTTIRSYTSQEGVHGKFQQQLFVHGKEHVPCSLCQTIICKAKVNGRGTYYCPSCQKEKNLKI